MSELDLSEAETDSLVAMVVRGMARGEASAEQQSLADAGLILIKGTIMMPTPAGTELVGSRLRLADEAPERERIMATFRRFLPINRNLRDLCTSWQLRPDGSVNDHSDETYDADVRDRLDDIDEAIAPCSSGSPRTSPGSPATAPASPRRLRSSTTVTTHGWPRPSSTRTTQSGCTCIRSFC